MDPNQQPTQPPQLEPQQPTPVTPPPYTQPPAPQPAVQFAPAPPTAYDATPQPTYDPNYLDSIAPAPARPKLFSGSFGKIFFALIAVFVLVVSFIVAASNIKGKTADLEQIDVRVTNFAVLAKTEQPNLKNAKLINTNTNFTIFLANAQSAADDLLKTAGVKKVQYDKKMTASEKALTAKLTDKFTDARLNVALDRIYASTMASETRKLLLMYQTMSKQSGAKAIRAYATDSITNLTPLQKAFADYSETDF